MKINENKFGNRKSFTISLPSRNNSVTALNNNFSVMKNTLTPQAQQMMCTKQVSTLANAIASAQGKSFKSSVEMAAFILKGNVWLNNPEGKTYLKDSGMTMEELINAAYKMQKDNYYLLVRMAKAIERLPKAVELFIEQCEASHKTDKVKIAYSVKNFMDYVKKLDNTTENVLNTEGVDEDEAVEMALANVEATGKVKPIVTFTFNGEAMDMANVSLRITDKGELKTSSSAEDVAKAIAYLQGTLLQLKAETQAKVEVKAAASLDKPKAAKVSKFKVKPLVSDADVIAEFEAELEMADFDTNAPF